MTLHTRLAKRESQIGAPTDGRAAVADLLEAVTGCQSEGNSLDRLGVALEQLLDHAARGFPVVFKDSLATHRGDVVIVRRYLGVDVHEAFPAVAMITLPDNGRDP